MVERGIRNTPPEEVDEQREREDAFEIYIGETADLNDPDYDYDQFKEDNRPITPYPPTLPPGVFLR